MKKGRVNVRVVPDTRRKKGQGRFPLKLRVTVKGERRYYGTGFDVTEEEWVATVEPDSGVLGVYKEDRSKT